MHSTVWNRFVRVGALVSLAAFALASVAGAEPAPRPGRRALNLFATSGLLLQANRIQCGIDNTGRVCTAFSGSPVGGGGGGVEQAASSAKTAATINGWAIFGTGFSLG